MANWWPCSNVKKLGVCCPITSTIIIRVYLVKPIDMEKSFKPSKELRSYIESARKKEKNIWRDD